MGVNFLAALWGFAEATLFFIVPDVLLSWLGLRDRRRALIASAYALVGALLGGALMYDWGLRDLSAVRAVLILVPGVDPGLLDLARHHLQQYGVLGLFKGALGGVPYKTYAIHAAAEGISFFLFMMVSVFARWLRFVVVIFATRWSVHALCSRYPLHIQRRWLMAGWIVFYVIYFTWLTH